MHHRASTCICVYLYREAFDREIGFYKTMDTYPMRKMMQWLPRYYASGQMKRGDQTVW